MALVRLPEEEYAEWMKGLQEVVRELSQALQGGDIQQPQLAEIVERAAQHYQHHFKATSTVPHRIYALYSSPLMSPLERAFTWLGGMRPSLSFQLIYSLTGHQIQAELEELLQLDSHYHAAGGPASLASLSASQLSQLSDLQTYTIQEEDRVEREMAKLQQSAADHRPLLLHIVGSASSSLSSSPPTITDDDIHRGMDSAISKKLTLLQEIFMGANSLRLSTLSQVLNLLHHPFQKAQYLLAAAKLQVALHHLGNAPATRRP